jgi:hypothetical protein
MMPIGRSAFPGVEKLGWFDGSGGSVLRLPGMDSITLERGVLKKDVDLWGVTF